MIDSLVCLACERIGFGGLSQLVPGLTAGQCRNVASALQAIDSRSETIDQVLKVEKAFSRRFSLSLLDRLKGAFYFRQTKQLEEAFVMTFQEAERSRRQTILTLAARAYTLDKGAPPKTAADLVPAYLKAVPQDLVTGADMTLGHSPR